MALHWINTPDTFLSTVDIEWIDTGARGSFLESPGNLTGSKSHFEIKDPRKVGWVPTSNEVHFVFLADKLLYNFQNF